MKEIKFRQAIFSRGKFQYWHYWGFIGGGFVGPATGMSSVEEALKNSQQYINRKDSNSNEIYVKDILEDHYWNSMWFTQNVVVEMPDIYGWLNGHRIMKGSYYKIIGNTTQDPELMGR